MASETDGISAPSTKRITLSDVAEHAGVSRATASLVLRGSGNLSDTTRLRVRASMDALGYVYHRGAASLRSSHTQTVGVIVSDISNAFTAELVVSVETMLAQAGFVTLSANTLEDPKRQDLLVRSMLERQVEGLLLIPALGSQLEVLSSILNSRVPAVVASRRLPFPELPYVGIDNVRGGQLAGDHLLLHSPKQVGFLGGYADLDVREDRVQGIKAALGKSNIELTLDLPGPPEGEWGLSVARELLIRDRLPDSIICHTDLIAFGVYRALREASRDVSQFHIISFDDVAEAELWEPPLTTVGANGQQVGERSADMLLKRIANPRATPEQFLITPELLVRQSCGCDPLAGTVGSV